MYGFTFDPLIGEFILSHPDIKIPEKGKIYAFNEGNYQLWSEEQKQYIDSLKEPEKWGGKPYSARYIGSLVGDFHRTLLYGGCRCWLGAGWVLVGQGGQCCHVLLGCSM